MIRCEGSYYVLSRVANISSVYIVGLGINIRAVSVRSGGDANGVESEVTMSRNAHRS